MALIYCSECGTEMSDQAYACPKCAHPVPQLTPLQPMAMASSTPFYFSSPFIIIALFFCPLIGLLLMWVGRVWTAGIRTAVSLVYAAMMILLLFGSFYLADKSTEQAGKQMEMIIEEMQKIQPPATPYPQEYYEELEGERSSLYDYVEQEPAQLTPAKKSVQIEIARWRWSNQASPPALKIEGTVKSKAPTMFQNLKVYVTAEDANGNLLGVGSAPLNPAILKPGGASNFVILINGAQCTTADLKPDFRIEY
jgi:hypothetical protein